MPRATARGGRSIDFRAMAAAVAGPGIDPRYWVSHGVVCTVSDDGEPNVTDESAVVVAPDGVWVDVLLVPAEIPVTARLSLGVGGQCSLLVPIHAGDEVLVTIPDGNMMNAPAIVAILNSMGAKVPLEADKKPVFRNDRVSFFARDVPMDIRSNSTRVELTPGGRATVTAPDIRLGGGDASQQVIKGNAHTASLSTFLTALDLWASAVQPIAEPLNLATPLFKTALGAFKSALAGHLSDVTKTK